MALLWKNLLIASTLLFSIAHAAPYSPIDVPKLLVKTEKGGSINKQYLQSRIAQLSQHAGSYPTQFDSIQDKNVATKETQFLLEVVKTITSKTEDSNALYSAMSIARIGHNLDIQGSAEQAVAYSKRYIANNPADSTGYLFLGSFLAETGKAKDAKPYLDKALKMGNEASRWPIALSYLSEGNQKAALQELKIYQKKFPNDKRAAELIKGIESGTLKLNKTK